MMQRPQSMNGKHLHTPNVSSSLPGTALGWCPTSAGTMKSNGLWNKASTSPKLSAATFLGLFSGLGTNGASGSSSPVDWNTGNSMSQLDYTNIDWSLDRGSSLRPGELWSGTHSNRYCLMGSGLFNS
ncbi:Hypothetical predicted protein [Olea europaea subsp. europaea]|uniref:Uncharacterized protein n=1 Tax=Olea europaea subsp. europaea TaxID=158383 RepID=A0A8S0R662_OLEEU|nr:Hypothetical predicted protein [Olea europaea subsp. europaea]